MDTNKHHIIFLTIFSYLYTTLFLIKITALIVPYINPPTCALYDTFEPGYIILTIISVKQALNSVVKYINLRINDNSSQFKNKVPISDANIPYVPPEAPMTIALRPVNRVCHPTPNAPPRILEKCIMIIRHLS